VVSEHRIITPCAEVSDATPFENSLDPPDHCWGCAGCAGAFLDGQQSSTRHCRHATAALAKSPVFHHDTRHPTAGSATVDIVVPAPVEPVGSPGETEVGEAENSLSVVPPFAPLPLSLPHRGSTARQPFPPRRALASRPGTRPGRAPERGEVNCACAQDPYPPRMEIERCPPPHLRRGCLIWVVSPPPHLRRGCLIWVGVAPPGGGAPPAMC
jgi:hypothetical protein